MRRDIRLVAFDFEGTLAINRNSSIMWESLAKRFHYEKERNKMVKAFFNGDIDYVEWADGVFDILKKKGLTKKKLEDLVERDLDVMPGAELVFSELKKRKIKTAVISGGIRNIFDLFSKKYRIKPDYVSIANGIKFDRKGNMVSGWCSDMDFEGKLTVLNEICEKEKIPLKNCAYVGDYVNDLHVFKAVGLPIAINTKVGELKDVAKVVIDKKNISPVLNHLY
jgi:phosphoserine phosphatase